jgi:hypothetical protein
MRVSTCAMLARAPNRKAAVAYLIASGASAISIIERDVATGNTQKSTADRFSITTGSPKKFEAFISTWWLPAAMASRVASRARLEAGSGADLAECRAAILASAAVIGAVLTADDVAISRAGAACTKLDSMIDQMRRSGQLREFNRQYKIRRDAAIAAGHGFMQYSAALKRLKAALLPMLMAGSAKPMASLFDQIFR